MTQKELLYMEDAIGHEQSLISIINYTINNLSDKDLISFLKDELKRHKLTLKKLMNKMEDISNAR